MAIKRKQQVKKKPTPPNQKKRPQKKPIRPKKKLPNRTAVNRIQAAAISKAGFEASLAKWEEKILSEKETQDQSIFWDSKEGTDLLKENQSITNLLSECNLCESLEEKTLKLYDALCNGLLDYEQFGYFVATMCAEIREKS